MDDKPVIVGFPVASAERYQVLVKKGETMTYLY